MAYSTTATTVPLQRSAYQSVSNPRELAPNVWSYDYTRDSGYQATRLPADQQSDNYRVLNEGYQKVKSGMFNPLTGVEPVFGNVTYPLNPLAQEQTNREGYGIQKQTRILDNRDPVRVMVNTPTHYPNYKGRPVYMNFPTGNQIRR